MEFIWFIVVGLVAVWLTGKVMKRDDSDVIGDIVIGVIGGLLSGFLFRWLLVSHGGGWLGSVIVAMLIVMPIGVLVLLFVFHLSKTG